MKTKLIKTEEGRNCNLDKKQKFKQKFYQELRTKITKVLKSKM